MRLPHEGNRWFTLYAILAHSGDSWFWLAGLAIAWLLGGSPWRYYATPLILGILGLAVLVLLIKFSVRRRRPEGEWGAIYRNTDPHSFPSGHAARAAMLAVVGLGLGPAWLGFLLLVWMPLVSLARVVVGVHYLSDVLVGLLLGVFAGGLVLFLNPYLVLFFPFLY
jgi:undecaprenyl-diphosphatase